MSRGAPPHFSLVEIILALEEIGDAGKSDQGIGRYVLASTIGASLASTRTLMGCLKEQGLIEASARTGRRGSKITKTGRIAIKFVRSLICPIAVETIADELTMSNAWFAVGVTEHRGLTSGVRQRDVAVFAGGFGALTLVADGKKLVFPDGYPTDVRLRDSLPKDTVVVIGLGKSANKAKVAAYSAAIDLLPESEIRELETRVGSKKGVRRLPSKRFEDTQGDQ